MTLRILLVAYIVLLSPVMFAQNGESDKTTIAIADGQELLIHLRRDGTIQVDGSEADLASVYDSIRSIIERDSTSVIVFSTSRQVKYMRYVEVLDVIRIAMRDGIAFSTYGRLFEAIAEAEQAIVIEALSSRVRLVEP